MAIVGDGDSITVFKAAGVATFPAADEKRAREIIRALAAEYSIIFVTEELASALGDFLKRFDEAPYPIVLPIPSKSGATGYGEELIRGCVERALGVDIFHNEK